MSDLLNNPRQSDDQGSVENRVTALENYIRLILGTNQLENGSVISSKIASGAITSVNISAGAITAEKINVSYLSAISANMGSVTAGMLIGCTIKTADNVGVGHTGVIIANTGLRGYHETLGLVFSIPTDGGAPTFSSGIINSTIFNINTSAVLRTSETVGDGSAASAGVLMNNLGMFACQANQALADANIRILTDGTVHFGSAVNYFSFDGAHSDATGFRYIEEFVTGEGITAGQPVCLGRGCYDHSLDEQLIPWRSAGVDSWNPDTNYHGNSYYRIHDKTSTVQRQEWVLLDFSFEDFSEVFTNCLAWFYTNSANVNSAGPLYINIYPITSTWDESTVTYNNLPTIGSQIGTFQVNNGDGAKYHSADITELMWKIKTGVITGCYGILLKGAQSNFAEGFVNFFTELSTDQEPGLRGRRMIYADKTFKAKSSITEGDNQEYRCFNFIGFAAESKNANEIIKVITHGVVDGLDVKEGETYYVGDSIGTIDTASSISANKPMYRVGKAISSTKLLIDKGEITFDIIKNASTSSVNPIYIPLYFRPREIQAFSSVYGGNPNGWSFGKYNNQLQYALTANSLAIASSKLCSYSSAEFAITHVLAGGVVIDNFPTSAATIFTFKG